MSTESSKTEYKEKKKEWKRQYRITRNCETITKENTRDGNARKRREKGIEEGIEVNDWEFSKVNDKHQTSEDNEQDK